VAIEVNALKGVPNTATTKPLASVKGTLWAGFVLAAIYYLWFVVMRS
jgi:hypothetical protein